ncbi:exonuclease subunit SbcD [compost metagenome]
MTNLFKRAAIFGDIHFGKKNNDRQFNSDCEEYVKWFIEQAKAFDVDTVIFLGDWHDNRHSIHVSTLNYSLSNMERLNSNFDNIYFITGNHDLYYKEKRELSSVPMLRNFQNITYVNEFLHVGGVTFCPWLVGDDWKKIPSYAQKSSYIFGHFELPNFMMNAMVEMPDHGGLNATHFDDVEFMAFSGHFHKRQVKNKVCYVGSPFPHTFADAWDDERGMVLLEWGQTPQFVNWTEGARYRTMNLSDLLEDPLDQITAKTFAKISSDLDITYEEVQFIKDIFTQQFTPRKLDIIPSSKKNDEQDFEDSNIKFQSVDQIVVEGLKNIDSLTMDKSILIDIYRSL